MKKSMKNKVGFVLCACTMALASLPAKVVFASASGDDWKSGDMLGAAQITCIKTKTDDLVNTLEIDANSQGNANFSGSGVYLRVKNYSDVDTPLIVKINSTTNAIIAPKTNVKQSYFDVDGNPVDGMAPRAFGNYMMLPGGFDGVIYMDYSTQMQKIEGSNDFDPSSIYRIYIDYSGKFDDYTHFAIGDIYTDTHQVLDTSSLSDETFATTFINQSTEYQTVTSNIRTTDFTPVGDLNGAVQAKTIAYAGFMIKFGKQLNLSSSDVYVRIKNLKDTNAWLLTYIASDWFSDRVKTSHGQVLKYYDADGQFLNTEEVSQYNQYKLPANFDGFIAFPWEGFQPDWTQVGFHKGKCVAIYFEAEGAEWQVGDVFTTDVAAYDGSEHYPTEFNTFTETWDRSNTILTHVEGFKVPEVSIFDYSQIEFNGTITNGVNIRATQNPNSAAFSYVYITFDNPIDLSEGEAIAINFKGVDSYCFGLQFEDEDAHRAQLPSKADAYTKPILMVNEHGTTSMNHTTGDDNTVHTVPGTGVMVIQKDFLAPVRGTMDWSIITKITVKVHTYYDTNISIVLGDIGTIDQTSKTHTVVYSPEHLTSEVWSTHYSVSDEYISATLFENKTYSEWIGDVKLIDSLNYASDAELKRNVTYDIGDNPLTYYKQDDGVFVHLGPYEVGHTYGSYACLGLFDKGNTSDRAQAWKMEGGQKIYAKGLTFYVKSLARKEIGITLQFDETIPGKSTPERWCVIGYPAMYYAWDVKTNAEYLMYAKSDQIQIPVGFEGYIRVPFESYGVPQWNAGLPGVDGVLNLDLFSGNFFLTSDNTRFSDLEFFIKNIGMYFNETEKSTPFSSAKSIKTNMGL